MRNWRPAAIFLLALMVRLPMLLTQHDVYLTGGIVTSLGLVARNLVEGRGLVETTGPAELLRLYDLQFSRGKLVDIRDFPDPPDQPTKPLIQRMPGYPVLLALIWKLTGSYRYIPIQVLQVLLSSLMAVALFSAGRRLFGETAGVVAGVLAAMNLAEARLAVVPLYDAWIVFLAGFLLWYLAGSAHRGYPVRDFLMIGLVLAFGAYFRSTVLVFPVFLGVALIPRLSMRRAAARGALALGVVLLALLPWAYRNQKVFGRPILTTTFFWPTIWEGFGEVPNRFGAFLDDRRTYFGAVMENPRLVYGTPDYDDHFRPKVIRIFSSRPGFVISLWARRLVRGLLFPGCPWGISAAEDPENSFTIFNARTGGGPIAYVVARPVAAVVKLGQRLWDPFLLLLALLTLVVDRHRFRDFLPFLALPVTFLATTVPLHLEGRYLLPGVPVWILFAAVPLSAWLASILPFARADSGSASPAV